MIFIKKNKKLLILISLILIIFLKTFIISNKTISGNSMSNTFNNNDVVLVEKISKKLKRYDVVIIDTKEKGLKGSVIKRVIGLPNETIQIKDGEVYINDEKLNDDVSNEFIEYSGIAQEKVKLDGESVFVLGDNRNNSEDSRNEWLGIVNINQIEGKPIFKIYPFSEISIVK